VSWKTWIIVLLLLTVLGVNVFGLLAQTLDGMGTVFRTSLGPWIQRGGLDMLNATQQAIQESATGSKAGIDGVANTAIGAIEGVEWVTERVGGAQPSSAPSSLAAGLVRPPVSTPSSLVTPSLAAPPSKAPPPEPVEAAPPSGKAGWCFVGQNQHVRTCALVGANDTCMSQQIFPSQALCINPSLRA
jgi:hypothetical protein